METTDCNFDACNGKLMQSRDYLFKFLTFCTKSLHCTQYNSQILVNTCLTSSNCKLGAIVIKGSAWNSGNEEWGEGSGKVIRCQSAVAKVKWSGGKKLEATYLLGTGQNCQLYLTKGMFMINLSLHINMVR